ncbi:hypothetical protein RJT34_28691 [Clitoria ternatea]|uniref:Zinc finger A20 and AN1 domain-containing stress-associated protein 3 n=1 Tax=Clitoria ternatea TaxID=43366 RepID=A0AAN9FEU1_CLITE
MSNIWWTQPLSRRRRMFHRPPSQDGFEKIRNHGPIRVTYRERNRVRFDIPFFVLLLSPNRSLFPFYFPSHFPFQTTIPIFILFSIPLSFSLTGKTNMAEEHRCQAPRFCANNCGFFGSPATQNLCSKCYRDLQLKEQQSSSAKLVLNQSLAPPPYPAAVSQPSSSSAEVDLSSALVEPPRAAEEAKPAQQNRCMTCRRRVGLTGFKCRCGMMLCGAHRYPEQHACEFDFKGMGREQIAKANPVIKADKLDKI